MSKLVKLIIASIVLTFAMSTFAANHGQHHKKMHRTHKAHHKTTKVNKKSAKKAKLVAKKGK